MPADVKSAPSGPRPVPPALLPEQGGWHVGEWWPNDRPRWVAVIDSEIELEPTHWLVAPDEPA